MGMYLRVSYTSDSISPRFPGNPENEVLRLLSMDRGDVCNAAEVYLFNHNGRTGISRVIWRVVVGAILKFSAVICQKQFPAIIYDEVA